MQQTGSTPPAGADVLLPTAAKSAPHELAQVELAALRTVARAVADGLSLEATVQFCLDETLKHLGLDFGSVYLRRHDYLIRIATHGLMVPGGPESVLPLAEAVWARQPFLASQGPEMDLGHLPAGVDGKSWMALPLRVNDTLVGVMILGGWGRGPSELPPLETASRVSCHIAAAVDNAARFESLRGILNDTRDVIFRTDEHGRFLVLNEAWQETMGEPVVTALGRRFSSYVADEQRRELDDGVHFVVPRGCVIGRRTLAFRTNSGTVRHFDVLARLLTDDLGRVVGTAGVLRDVSRTVRQARAIAEANAKLRRHAAELEQANRELAEADRLKSEFLANVSHEFRTPLGIMLGYCEMLADGLPDPVTEGQLEYLDAIHQAGESLRQMLAAVLDLASIEAGRAEFEVIAAPLGAVLRGARQRHSQAASTLGLRIEPPDDAASLVSLADPERLDQVLDLLIDNALKFSGPGGSIRLTAQPAAGPEPRVVPLTAPPTHALVRVIDNGIGLEPEQRAGLFRKFVQADGGATRERGGLGLGLVTARAIIERMGGRIDLLSDGPGRGAEAVFTLPLAASTEPR